MRPFDTDKPLGTSHPIGHVCPKCGSTEYKRVKSQAMVAFTDDRVCKQCATRYTPPTPLWARAIFGFFGLIAVAGGLGLLGAAVFGGSLQAAIAALPCGLVGIGCLYKAFTA